MQEHNGIQVKKKNNIRSITITNDAQNIFHGQDRNLIQNLHCFTSTTRAKRYNLPCFIYVLPSLTKKQLYKSSETQHGICWWRFTCCCTMIQSSDPRVYNSCWISGVRVADLGILDTYATISKHASCPSQSALCRVSNLTNLLCNRSPLNSHKFWILQSPSCPS